MILVYWTTTQTTEYQVEVSVTELLDAITKSGQNYPERETDEEYVSRVMDDVDMTEVLPILEAMASVEINSDDSDRSFDDWGWEEEKVTA